MVWSQSRETGDRSRFKIHSRPGLTFNSQALFCVQVPQRSELSGDSGSSSSSSTNDEDEGDDEEEGAEEEEDSEPLSLQWPQTPTKQASYLFLLPIVFPLWLTLPDVRNLVRITFIQSFFIKIYT